MSSWAGSRGVHRGYGGGGAPSAYQPGRGGGGRRGPSGPPPGRFHARRPSRGTGALLCEFYATTGTCRFGQQCRYTHELWKTGTIAESENGGFLTCAVIGGDEEDQFQLVTGSRDAKIKTWTVAKTSQRVHEVDLATEWKCEASVSSTIFAMDCIFAGLKNGKIRVVHRPTGNDVFLEGHSTEVLTMLVLDNVLISAEWGGNLKLWQYNMKTDTFEDTHTVVLEAAVTCMCELRRIKNDQEERHLWIGCMGGIVILDLLTLTQSKIKLEDLVMGLIPYGDEVFVVLLNGRVAHYTNTGEKLSSVSVGSGVSSVIFCKKQDGLPVIVLGGAEGILTVLELPALTKLGSIKPHTNAVKSLRAFGENLDQFVSVGDDGRLFLWRWERDIRQA